MDSLSIRTLLALIVILLLALFSPTDERNRGSWRVPKSNQHDDVWRSTPVTQELSGLGNGCVHVYLDFGSNVGVQVRKLFEPALYTNAPILPFFDKYLGQPALRRLSTCAFGFEINPLHTFSLQELQTAYLKKGWRTFFFTETGIGANDTTMIFHSDGDAKNLFWAAKLTNENVDGGVEIQVVSIVRFMQQILQRILPGNHGATEPRIVVKLDVEGHELDLLLQLANEKLLCSIHFVYIELHPDAVESLLTDIRYKLSADLCQTEIVVLDDEEGHNSYAALPERR